MSTIPQICAVGYTSLLLSSFYPSTTTPYPLVMSYKHVMPFQVWFRVIQVVINRDDIQGYAAKTVFEALQSPTCHENMIRVGGYILGEFGNLIAGDHRSR
jgi:hypothetical protein